MTTTLDPVQIAALDFARDKPGVAYNCEQGLGKTLIATTEFDYLYFRKRVDRMVVICPNTFKQGWIDEFEKHQFCFESLVYQSSKKALANAWLLRERHGSPPVLIVNYEAVRRPEVLKAVIAWARRGPTYLAVDESIQIKGHKTSQTRSVHWLAKSCKFVRLLSGRMQTQGPHDLWAQLRAIGLFENINYYAFRGAFCVMGGWENKEVVAAKNPGVLANYMRPVVFQAKKKDWLTLPRKDFTIRDYKMSPEQLAQYNQMEHEFLLEVERGVITVDVAIAKYAKLAQIQIGFVYDATGNAHQLVEPAHNPRLALLKELLLDEVEGKAVVVYRHRWTLNLLEGALTNYRPAHIKGGMKPEEVQEQKRIFNEVPKCRLLFAQCDASKYGHTLTASGLAEEDKCRTMIFFENSYSADTRDQIEDRIHRRGQTGERVLYIDLSGSPLDRKIVKALQRKDALYQTVFKNLRASTPDGPANLPAGSREGDLRHHPTAVPLPPLDNASPRI